MASCVICAIVFMWLNVSASAEEVLIVLSSQAKPYMLAAEECEARLGNAGIQIKRVLLANISVKDIQQNGYTVVAIGGRASAMLAHELPAQYRLYYCMTPRPEQIGLVKRDNTSGISTDVDLKEQIEQIKRGMQSVQRVGVLYRSSSVASSLTINAMRSGVPPAWEIVAVDFDKATTEAQGIKQLLKEDIDIVWTVPDPSVYNQLTIKALLLGSLRKGIPVFGFSHSLVRAGAAYGIGIDPKEQGRRIADLVLNQTQDVHLGAAPKIAVNLIVAERIKIKIPESFIQKSDVVYRSD